MYDLEVYVTNKREKNKADEVGKKVRSERAKLRKDRYNGPPCTSSPHLGLPMSRLLSFLLA